MPILATAQAEYAAISRKLKNPALTGKERGILHAQRNKVKVRLRAAYAEAEPVAVVAPVRSPNGIERSAPSGPPEASGVTLVLPREVHFDFYLSPSSPAMQCLCEYVFDQWTNHEQGQRRRALGANVLPSYRLMVGVVVSNLVHALTIKNTAGVYVTRRKKILARPNPRYRPEDFNEKFLLVLDGLITIGIVGQRIGEWHGDRTVLTAGRRLVGLVRRFGTRHREDVIANRARQEVLLLKAPQYWDADETSLQPMGFDPGELAEYDDTELTRHYRKEVRSINEYLEGLGMGHIVTGDGLRFIDERDCFVQRQFTYGSFEKGGRLKNGYWNNGAMTSAEHFSRLRPLGERPVKLDYRSMQMHLLYSKAGLRVPTSKFTGGDLYAIPGLSPASRPGIKKFIAAQSFRTTPLSRFPEGVGKLFTKQEQGLGALWVWSKILEAHPAIAHLFNKGEGHSLQFHESSLMVKLLLEMKKMGYWSLPIHDCLLVPRSQAFDVQTRMELVSEEYTRGTIIPVGKEERLD